MKTTIGKLRLAGLLALAISIVAGSSAEAQLGPNLPSGRRQVSIPPEFAVPLEQAANEGQMAELTAGARFRPGVYLIRPLNAQLCLEQYAAGGLERPYIRLANCNLQVSNQHFALIPSVHTKATIRTTASLGSQNRLTTCATVARGVVFGPPRIDLLDCDFGPGDQSWFYVGNRDQRMELIWSPQKSAHEIKTNDGFGTMKCWAMRGDGNGVGTDVIQWDCNGQNDQFFNLVYLRPLDAGVEAEALKAFEWLQTPDGPRKRPRVGAMDIPGGDYAAFETINDSGEYCSMRCVESPECKAYTWKGPNYYFDPLSNQPPTKPMCHLKSSVGQAFFRGVAKVHLIRSGIVRP